MATGDPPGTEGSNRCDREPAISEVIGAILLIALVVTAVAILLAAILSGPLPEQVPKLTIVAARNLSDDHVAYLYHAGGDVLRADQFYVTVNRPGIRIDPNAGSPVRSADILEDGSIVPSWSVNRVVAIENNAKITSAQVIYRGNTGDFLLYETDFPDVTAIPTTTTTATTTATTSPTTTATTTVTTTGTTTVTTTATTTVTTSPTTTATTPPPCSCFYFVDFSYRNIGSLNVQFWETAYPSPDSCSWNFGDGGTSGRCWDTYKYDSGGTYMVTLTVRRYGCGTCSVTKPVTVT